MRFRTTPLPGCVLLETEVHADDRGFFCRLSSEAELREAGLGSVAAETSLSYNRRRSTLRGLHFQRPPHEERKLVRCLRGSIFDVAVDLRPGSPSHMAWTSAILTAENRLALFVPPGVAHGFLTLEDDTEVLYQISPPYHPDSAGGIRWDDPRLAIEWPAPPEVVSDRDRSLPLLADLQN
ncbi:MAG TPA: dTDP-4-dehydrorhamnose 3,5-epimerase [Acidimicrobiales bacterium]|nr:dTDP-4-dehydrorhamnose 3,5-epimerase [Acidimicrobiales bacterium]